jgi:hypothetical protein
MPDDVELGGAVFIAVPWLVGILSWWLALTA